MAWIYYDVEWGGIIYMNNIIDCIYAVMNAYGREIIGMDMGDSIMLSTGLTGTAIKMQ